MERQFPAGLSAEQRSALCDFYAGRISAGQLLTLRLGIEAPPPRDPPAGRRRPAPEVDREAPREQPGGKAFPARHRAAGSREPAGVVD